MIRHKLDDSNWNKIYACLKITGTIYTGNEEKCQTFVDGVHWSMRTGAQWRALLAHYPDQSILLIWDQARFHTSQLVEEWLVDHPHITTMLLPKYAPELNPIEDIWQVLKDRFAANLTRKI